MHSEICSQYLCKIITKGEVRWGLILKRNSFRHFWRIITIYSAGHFRETQFSITASLPEHLQGLHLKDVIFQLFLLSLVIYFLCFIASHKAEKNSFWEKHGIELQKIQCFWSSEFNFFLFDYPTIYISLTYPKRYIMFHMIHYVSYQTFTAEFNVSKTVI